MTPRSARVGSYTNALSDRAIRLQPFATRTGCDVLAHRRSMARGSSEPARPYRIVPLLGGVAALSAATPP